MIKIGIEKEFLMFDDNFEPKNFDKKDLKDKLTLDFSDNHLEIVSSVHSNLNNLIKEMYDVLNDESIIKFKMWPLSSSGINNYEPKFNSFEKIENVDYRKKLIEKYPKEMLNLSGIHLNINFSEMESKTYMEQKKYYFEIMKKIYVFAPIMLQFVGYTPVYENGIYDDNLEIIGKNKGFKNSLSLRNSIYHGYNNESNLGIDYSSIEHYEESIKKIIAKGLLLSDKEIYSKVRLKKNSKKDKGICYLELRFLDLNPDTRLGIKIDVLEILIMMIEYLQSVKLYDFNIKKELQNFENVAINGLDKDIILNINGRKNTLKHHTNYFFSEIKKKLVNNLTLTINSRNKKLWILQNILDKYNANNLDIDLFLKKIKSENLSISDYGKKYAYQKEKYINLYENKNLELSTKILMNEAQKQDIDIEIIDEEANAIILKKRNKEHIIIQATKTNLDRYADVLVMENKILTKKVLKSKNVNVADDILIYKKDGIENNYLKIREFLLKQDSIIKPYDTNFGLGISVLFKKSSKNKIIESLNFAFKYSDKLILEKFFKGNEYRFLVVNYDVVSIVRRYPANITGDGKSTIKELIDKKNADPLRGKNYKTPYEKIEITSIIIDFLKDQELYLDTIISNGKKIYLRGNSNISTGGDASEEYDLIPDKFKEIAKNTAKNLNVKICGIDMIINETFDDYIIVEANFNPAIQMHTYPLQGIGKEVAKDILKLLF